MPREFVEITIDDVGNIIKNMKNSNTTGLDKISYNMLKNADEIILVWIRKILSIIINKCIFPTDFNTSLILPIKKEVSKLELDLNNLRPISISNCLAQIFEKFILTKQPLLDKTEKKQFGFKKGISTLHPLFIVKETSLWCKKTIPLYT